MSTDDQKPDIQFNIDPRSDTPDYISDPEYISKIINQFILKDDIENSNSGVKSPSSKNKHYNREHIVNALTNMQLSYKPKYISGQTVNINTDAFKSTLMNNIARLDDVAIPKSMNQIDSRTIDFVEMIFSAFLRDNNISDAIKDLLLLMQIPVIKVALLDNKIFNTEKHPARYVLNSIAHIGIGIEDKENTVYKTMQYIIEQLLQSFGQSLEVFATIKLSLDRLSNIQKTRHEQTEKQSQQLITREYTRQLVLKELQYYTLNTPIPNAIQPLILSHWSTLMYQRFNNYGKESIEWREVIGILRLLVKSFRPVNTREDWLALRSIYKGIVNSMRSCLDNSHQNKEKIFIATSNLNNYYIKKLSESEFHTDSPDESGSGELDYNILDDYNSAELSDIELSPLDKQAAESEIMLEKMADFIRPNTWFEVFTDYKHPVRRLKLSVILKEQAKLVFVDFMGNKVIEKSLKKFITELKNDQSRSINDHSIFEYALSMVIISIAVRE